jgi:hypothetical protein
MARPIVNVTRLRARSGEGSFPLEVLLLGPDPAAPSGGYVARLTIAPDETPIDLDVDLDALLRALAPVLR